MQLEDIEALILELPITSDLRGTTRAGEDHWADLARRGIFAFDWSDIHRTIQNEAGAYELLAAPVKPIKLDELPVSLGQVARSVTFATAIFDGNGFLDVRAYAECREPI